MIKIKHVSIFLVFGLIISMSFSVATPVKSLSFTGGFYSVQNLRYSCSSMCTYWVHGANAWNNISTKVHSSRHYGVDSDGHARLYGTTTTVSGLLGQVFPYTQYGVGVDPIYDGTGTGRWVFAIGVLYTNNLTSDQMRRAVAVHEF